MARRRRKRTGIGIIAFVVLCVCGIVAYGKINLEKQRDAYTKELEDLDSKTRGEEERRTDIKNMKAYVTTKKYIEQIAREKLGLVYEYEIIFNKEEEE